MLHHYDHRWATYTNATDSRLMQPQEKEDPESVAQPRYWVPEKEVRERVKNKWSHEWLLGFRRVARSTDERSAIFTMLPASGPGDSVFLMIPEARVAKEISCLYAGLDTFAYDFVVRQKVGGMNFNFYIVEQLPVLPPETYDAPAAWEPGRTLSDWISSRVLELTYMAWDLAPFARDLGYEGPPFAWDPERRFRLRCELDAAYFHLYGIAREDVEYIMDTFLIVRRKDEAAHGEYRTRRVILEIYDQMAAAMPEAAGGTVSEPETPPATVTRLHPRPRDERPDERRDEQPLPAEIAAEEKRRYDATPRRQDENPAPTKTEAPVDAILQNADFTQPPPEHQNDGGPARPEERQPTLPGQARPDPPAPEAPNPYDAALALNACLPDGQKVPKDTLLQDAARELGHPKLARKVKTALNKALNTEHNAGRLKTDWKLVWRPKK